MTPEYQITIREAEVGDVELLYRLVCALEEMELSHEDFCQACDRNLPAPNTMYLIAEADGVPVGMGSCHVQWLLHHAAPIAEIQELYVLPEYRSKAVGARLMAGLKDFARTKKALQIEVSTHKKRTEAHRFYAREKFTSNHFKWVFSIAEENSAS